MPSIIDTTPSTQHHRHNTIGTTPSAQHHRHNTIGTTPSAQHHRHNTIGTTPSTQHHRHNTIDTTPSTQHHRHNTIDTTPSTQHQRSILLLSDLRFHFRLELAPFLLVTVLQVFSSRCVLGSVEIIHVVEHRYIFSVASDKHRKEQCQRAGRIA